MRTHPLLALAVAALALTGCDSSEAGTNPEAQPESEGAANDDSKAIARWLTELDGWLKSQVPLPEGKEFPVGFSSTPSSAETLNASFHLWSYQMFLWLMQPSGAGSRRNFETMPAPIALFTGDRDPGPYPSQDQLELTVLDKSHADRVDAGEVTQAGPGNTVLVDQNEQIVFYSIHLNREFWDFIRQHELYTLDGLQKLEKTDPNLTFPADALELKVSWRIARWLDEDEDLIPDAEKRFYTTTATVPTIVVDGSSVRIDRKKTRQAMVAMVGMHVTGVVKDHPEFIWATFEHRDNAPDSDGKKPEDHGPASAPGEAAWSFYDGTTPYKQANMYPGTPKKAANVTRIATWGGGSDTNKTNLEHLDAGVRERLDKSDRQLLKNYFMPGAVWTSGQQGERKTGPQLAEPVDSGIPGARGTSGTAKASIQRGSLQLANTSMETFTQRQNCFDCHNSSVHVVTVRSKAVTVPQKAINLSHFVVNFQAGQLAK